MKEKGQAGLGVMLLAACFMLSLGTGGPVGVPPLGGGGVPALGGALVELPEEETAPLVALTFDDGPRNTTTGRLLDGLAERQAKATFFLLGMRIEGSEALVRRMDQEGHQIGVHPFEHVHLTDLSHKDLDLQNERTTLAIREIVGEGEFWLRPPYGKVNKQVESWSNGPLIKWSVDPRDWLDHDIERIVRTVVERVEDGDIILLHDIYDSSVDAALQIVDELQAKGYCFVTVEELLARRQTSPEAGVVYTALPPAEDKG